MNFTKRGLVRAALAAASALAAHQAWAYPTCSSSAVDPDGDGWGWENNQSCIVSKTSSGYPTCASAASDPDGDGWGWENNQSCKVATSSSSSSSSSKASSSSSSSGYPTCASASSDPDGDGWGWENNQSCKVATSSSSSSSSSKSSASASSTSTSSSSSASSTSTCVGVGSGNGKRQVEALGRGVTAMPASNGMLVSWRLLATDYSCISFNVYRGSTRLNSQPITGATNFLDTAGSASASYSIRPIYNGGEQASIAATVSANPYLKVGIQQPSGGTTPDGVAYTYEANDGTVADLDGDGEYEIVLKWQPTNAKDNSQSGYTGNTIVDAYKLNGARLWRIDLGQNIRAGAHYTTILAYDFDGDGKAEVMMKTADGTRDGQGTVIGSSSADYRNSKGYILSGPEYLTVFNGKTGAALATTDYLPARGTVSSWGDSYGNRVDRFLGTVAYLDGARPSAVFARGYYTRAVVVAWDYRNGTLSRRWTYDSGNASGNGAYGQGAHHMSVGDVNGDGKDEIIYGAATIASDGSLLYSTKLGHGDALHVGKFDPSSSGLQVVMPHESPSSNGSVGFEMHDGASGGVLWKVTASGDIGRGMVADIDPNYPGAESWSTADNVLRSASGSQISSSRPSMVNFAVWWDGDLSRELLDNTLISKWNTSSSSLDRLLTGYQYGAASNNGTKATPVLSADILGDWREEVVLRSSDNTALLIFSTPYATSYRIPTLMHDTQYRAQVAGQNTGYNQPPNPSFFLGNGMGSVSFPSVYSK